METTSKLITFAQTVWQCVLIILLHQATECTEFSERISYEITLMFAETNFTITANNSICTPLSRCDAVFVHRGFTGRNFTVYLRAVNSVGKSNISTYSDVILGKLSCMLFLPGLVNLFYSSDLCDPPMSPVNGSVSGQSSLCPPGSEVTYHCNSGLFPTGVMTSTCTDVGGRGEWVPDPGQLVCSNETKGNHVLHGGVGIKVFQKRGC